jgi:tetratricopeptide (TPR) repeat protein
LAEPRRGARSSRIVSREAAGPCGAAQRGRAPGPPWRPDADALRHYERAAAIRPGHTKTLIRLADTFRALGNNEAAETSLRQALATRPADTAIMLRLGSLYQTMRRNEPAREMFELACRTNPRLPEPWLCLARLANQVSSFADALRILEEGRQAAGESVPMLLAEIGLLQGRGLVREAEKRLALAEAFDPHDRHVRRQRIDTDIAQGRFVRAAETVARLPGATPAERAQRHLMQGQIAEAQRNPTAARDAFQAALKEDDRLAAAHEGLARARLLLRQPGEARASLVAARQLQAGELIARGRSSTPLRGVLGELINEARIALAAEAGWEPAEMESVQALLRSHRAAPDLTSLTLAVLGSLRRGGRLDPRPEVAGAPLRVPRLIHQYWDMPALPAEVAELMRSWRLENPGWSYRRHDRASARQYLIEHGMPEAARAFAAARQPAQQADLFRLAILLLEGGVYADADDRCVAPLDEALGGVEFLSWQEGLGSVGNNFIAVVPGHPVIASALEQAMEAMFRGDAETMWMSTGPGLLSRSLVQYLAGDTTRLGALGREIVILERWDLRRFCVPHCKTSYKLGGNHWFSRELAQQPK